jgi:hypothetical protein
LGSSSFRRRIINGRRSDTIAFHITAESRERNDGGQTVGIAGKQKGSQAGEA